MTPRASLAILVPALAAALAACQAPAAAPTAVAASASPPAAAASPAPAPLAFAPLTADQVAFLRRRPGHDPYHNAAGAVVAGWDAPPETRSGNWAFHLHVPERVLAGAGTAGATTTAASAAIDAAEVPLVPGADAAPIFAAAVAAWAPDARPAPADAPVGAAAYRGLQQASLPLLPAPAVVGTPAPLPDAWASAARGETLAFYRAGDRAVALRVRWAPAPAAAEAKVDAAAATAALTAALADPKAVSVEAREGRDWFVGLPFTNGDRLPVGCLELRAAADATMRVEPEPAVKFLPPVLERRFGKLVWRINEDEPGPACRVGPTLEMVFDQKTRDQGFVRVHGAGGYVDALTGAVVRFRRTYRVYGVEGMGTPIGMFAG